MLEKFERRSYIGRLVYSRIELLSKLSVRISFYENLSPPPLSLSLSLFLSLSPSLCGLTADRLLLFWWFTSTVNRYDDVGTVN